MELNYRSTPQILAVGKALLTEAGTEPKELRPTVPGEGKAPVRLLVLDTEEQEASVIAKVSEKHSVSTAASIAVDSKFVTRS